MLKELHAVKVESRFGVNTRAVKHTRVILFKTLDVNNNSARILSINTIYGMHMAHVEGY